ncbi:MAG: Subtilase family [Pseudomonadota bacterium]|jgi:hypothetical protein
MCNFVPGECLAFGKLSNFAEVSLSGVLGDPKVIPLRPRNPEPFDERDPFDGYGFIHITSIPFGLEVLAISQLSAALAPHVKEGQTIVELNHYMPHAMRRFEPLNNMPLSEPAFNWAQAIRKLNSVSDPLPPPAAFIDSGIGSNTVPNRKLIRLDFTNGVVGLPDNDKADTRGHGTRVARILHECLPGNVPLISAKIADTDSDVTVLNLCRTFAEVVTCHQPAIVNISLAPLEDTYVCPNCSERVKTPAFHSGILRRVIGLANRTFVVMAAGNEGQACNQNHVDKDVNNLIFAVAIGSRGRQTRYSASPTGPNASNLTAFAFGGDDTTESDGIGVFTDDRSIIGTSFAAPFVSASVYSEVVNFLRRTNEPVSRAGILSRDHSEFGSGWYPDFLRREPRWAPWW